MMMKRMIYPICLLAVLMVLAGCQLGKHYTDGRRFGFAGRYGLGRTLHRYLAAGAHPQDAGV